MASLTSVDDERSITDGASAPGDSELRTGIACASSTGKKTVDVAQPDKQPPAKLKLKLRKPEKPAPDTVTPRRSLRTIKNQKEHDDASSTSGASRPEKKSNRQKTLQPKPGSPAFSVTPQQPYETTDVAIEPMERDLPRNTPDLSSNPRHGKAALNINPGNANDPIDVDSLPSPPPPPPHMFMKRSPHYYAPLPLQYKPSRPSLPPTLFTPNGAEILSGKVSGHQSHDIYRMFMDGKNAPAPEGFSASCAKLSAEISTGRSRSRRAIPGVAYMRVNEYGQTSGRVPSYPYAGPLQMRNQSYPHDYRAHTSSYHTPIHGYPIFPVLNEDHLRQRAVQFVLDHSRPVPRKRRLSDDPDETSSSEYEDEKKGATEPRKKKPKRIAKEMAQAVPSSRPMTPAQPSDECGASTPSTGVSEDNMFDRNLKLTELVEHTQLLTAMLMTYPRSADQEGLREDIAMLATVTDKCLAGWNTAEADFDLETRQRLTLAKTPTPDLTGATIAKTGSKKKDGRQTRTEGKEAEMQQDEDVRRYLFAGTSVWDKQSGGEGAAQGVGEKQGEHGRNDSGLGDAAALDEDVLVPAEEA